MTRQLDNGWLDATYPIRESVPVWPGQPDVSLRKASRLDEGDTANVTVLRMAMHTGTHMDAPLHFLQNGGDITTAPTWAMMGAVRVAHLPDDVDGIDRATVETWESQNGALQSGERVFFRTRNSNRDWSQEKFHEDYVAVLPDAATYLVEKGLRVVGVDYLSVAPFDNPTDTHRILLSNNVWVIEALNLRDVAAGRYEMVATPLPLVGSDASPVRVLLKENSNS